MSFVSFGLNSPKNKQARPKKQPLAEFAEPTEDHPLALDTYTPAQREEEATRLQEEGNAKAEARDYSGAIRLWDQALLFTPKRAVLHELKSQVFMEVDHPFDAIRSATQATELAPTWPEGFLTLARAQLAFGEPEAALEHMERVLALQPGHSEAAAEIASIRLLVLQRRKDPASAGQRLRVI